MSNLANLLLVSSFYVPEFYTMHRWVQPSNSHPKQELLRNKLYRLFKAFDFLRQSGGYDLLKNIIAPTLPTKSAGASALSSATSSNVLPAF